MSAAFQYLDLVLSAPQLHLFYEELRKIARVEHENSQGVNNVEMKEVGSNFALRVQVQKIDEVAREECVRRSAERKPFTEVELRHILCEIAQGLKYAKSKRIPHGRISPNTIGRGSDGRYKVTWLQLNIVPAVEVTGTNIYASPEARIDFASDVFSLGMTMLFLAGLGEPIGPYDVTRLSSLQPVIQALSYPLPFKNLLTSMLSLDPQQRPTVEQICTACQRPYIHFLATAQSAGEVPPSVVRNFDSVQVDIHDGWLDVFDCASEEWKDTIQVTPAIDVQYSMAFAFLPGGDLFICGGIEPTTAKSWAVSLSTRQVTSLPPMSVPRSEHSAQYVNGSIYVFGGRGADKAGLFSAEKFGISTRRWTALRPSPYFVCWTTACVHNDFIILPGGFGTDLVQLFSLTTEQYSLLNYRLPATAPTFSLIDRDSLVVVQKGWAGRCHLGSTQGAVTETAFEDYWFGGMPAVVCGRRAYLMLSRKELKALDLNSI